MSIWVSDLGARAYHTLFKVYPIRVVSDRTRVCLSYLRVLLKVEWRCGIGSEFYFQAKRCEVRKLGCVTLGFGIVEEQRVRYLCEERRMVLLHSSFEKQSLIGPNFDLSLNAITPIGWQSARLPIVPHSTYIVCQHDWLVGCHRLWSTLNMVGFARVFTWLNAHVVLGSKTYVLCKQTKTMIIHIVLLDWLSRPKGNIRFKCDHTEFKVNR